MFGYADVKITHEQAAFPYVVTAFTHTNQEVTLIHSLDRENIRGFISRNMADLTLKLYLKDLEGRQRYIYNCSCDPDKFKTRRPRRSWPGTAARSARMIWTILWTGS